MLALIRRARRRPAETLALALCLSVGGYVIVGPMLAARYPMMQDLPFHAANASIFLHYFDPSYHFREQFVLQPFAVPYVTFYLLAALCMLLVDAVAAVKIACSAGSTAIGAPRRLGTITSCDSNASGPPKRVRTAAFMVLVTTISFHYFRYSTDHDAWHRCDAAYLTCRDYPW